jgi:hypothetical protein
MRRTDATDWAPVGSRQANAEGLLEFEDRDVVGDGHYGYGLGQVQQGRLVIGGETWVTVPKSVELSVRVHPNPAPERGGQVAFSLSSEAPAILELLDVGGRRIWGEDVGHLGPGRHAVPLGGLSPLRPGIYIIRLDQDGISIVSKVCVVT